MDIVNRYVPRFDLLSPTQQLLALILVRLRRINPNWGDYAQNFAMHCSNVAANGEFELQELYVTLFMRIEIMYGDFAPTMPMANSTVHGDQREWLLTLISEPYRCLEQIRTVIETRYRPLPLDHIVDNLRVHTSQQLQQNIIGIHNELKVLRNLVAENQNL